MTLEELIAKHKILQNVECGVTVPVGWISLLDKCATELSEVEDVLISQVKEKFGRLVIYTQLGGKIDSKVDRIITKYEDLSIHTCRMCGVKELPFDMPRHYALCDWCAKALE